MNSLLAPFLRFFFHLLYGKFAWTYDFIADLVSIGRWKQWIQIVLPYLRGTHILELGHGPGHLQHILSDRNLVSIGLDRSRQMGNIARKNLRLSGYAKLKLVSAEAQNLPFISDCFDTIFATFPTEYFYNAHTLTEVRRTLKSGGRFVVLPVAWVTGTGIVDRFAAWLFQVTGQAPSDLNPEANESLAEPFNEAGFDIQVDLVDEKSSRVLIIITKK